MLIRTFCHLRGLSRTGEERLWSMGVLCWNDFERMKKTPFSEMKKTSLRKQLVESREALAAGDFGFFLSRLPATAGVRILPHARERIAYVDIETTGLGDEAQITTIALYNGRHVRVYVKGRDLRQFVDDIEGYDVLVTYNGTRFDLPRLRCAFRIPLDQPHIDLCPVLHAYGYWGGMKQCEKRLGIERKVPEEIDGREAVRLWRRYETSGDSDALRLLIAYNAQDVLSLEHLLIKAYNRSMESCPMAPRIDEPTQPDPTSFSERSAVHSVL